MKKNITAIMLGVVLILVGIFIALTVTDVIKFNVFFDGWFYLLLVILGFFMLFSKGKSKMIAVCLISISSLLLAEKIFKIESNILQALILPVLIIILGMNILIQSSKTKMTKHIKSSDCEKSYSAVFSSVDETLAVIGNVELKAIFGAIKLDLRDCVITSDIYIKSTAIFAGIEVSVSRDVNVVVEGINVLGGFENRVKEVGKEVPTIYCNSTNVFSGFKIR